MESTILTIANHDGVVQWVQQSLEDIGHTEVVSRSDLGRVVRLLEATNANVVLVEADENDIGQCIAVISAIINAQPWVNVVALGSSAEQGLLLQCVRAGARDFLVSGAEPAELRERVRRYQGSIKQWDEHAFKQRNVTMVVGASPHVDTQFFTQHLAAAMATLGEESHRNVLAIDLQAHEASLFHLDQHVPTSLNQLMMSAETVDESLVETALEEYRPGLRMLPGGTVDELVGDRGADLFIVLTRLMNMFDEVVINVGYEWREQWLAAIGVHVQRLLVLTHQTVPQIRSILKDTSVWKALLSAQADIQVVVDGYENSLPPSRADVAQSTELTVAQVLPIEWKSRVEAINLGKLLPELETRSAYYKSIEQLAGQLLGVEVAPSATSSIKKLFARAK